MVSVKQALNKGQLTINIPVFFIMFGVISLLFYLSAKKEIPFYFTPLSFVIGPFCGWIYWSFAIVKWKLWAFKNVRNRHELKEKAIRTQLIWPDSSIFNKTEIWTDYQKREWIKINKKFKDEDIVKDNLSIPFETIIEISKTIFWLNISGILSLIALSIYLYFEEKKVTLYIVLFSGYAIYLLFTTLKNKNKKLYIKLNEKGIETSEIDFISWNNIKEISVKSEGFGKGMNFFLRFNYHINNEFIEEKINLKKYSSNFEEVNDLIKIYRKRYKNNERTNN